ncbi:hypothetical protein K1719_029591 [Acacia pycnantha]|nr:hypothetical protein K1719_029591 [Acacia pycnantha]
MIRLMKSVRDAFGVQDDNFTKRCGVQTCFLQNDAAREFFSLMDESDRPLYQGCRNTQSYLFLSNCTISSACVGSPIRQCRCSGITSRCFPRRGHSLILLRGEEDNQQIRLELRKIDACPNDCMLYWGEDDRRETCKKCHTSRFKTIRKGRSEKKKLRRF